MDLMPVSRTARVLLLALVCTGLVAGGLLWYAGRDSHAEVVTASSTTGGWKTIEFQGVRVDIPASWEPVDTDDCEFHFERWAPPASLECDGEGGLAFYASATFDPAHGPGIRRGDSPGAPVWAGYAYAGDLAVYASDDDRALLEKVLTSAR